MTFLWIAVVVLSLVVTVCLLALVDQYRTLEVIRARLELEDAPHPIPIPLGRATNPSAVGLPATLDAAPHLVALFLSTSCSTCRSIASGLREHPSSDVWVVLQQAGTAEEGTRWLTDEGLVIDRATIDVDGQIAAALGVSIIPSAVVYRDGEVLLAQSIPSFRQLTPLFAQRKLPPSVKLATRGTIQL